MGLALLVVSRGRTPMQYNTHDVVEFEVDGEMVEGVVRDCDADSITAKVRRSVVEDTYETETVWVEGTTAYVAPDEATLVGSPDTETLHPNDYNVDHHVERLPDEESEDENDAEEPEETESDEAENTEAADDDEQNKSGLDTEECAERGCTHPSKFLHTIKQGDRLVRKGYCGIHGSEIHMEPIEESKLAGVCE